jgi:tetratricopeptide (TPR) repeat protein
MASTRYLKAGFSPSDPIIVDELAYIDYFIFGTIQRQSNSISVVLKISKTIAGDIIWEKEYTSDISTVRQLWTSIATEVANEFDIKKKDVRLLRKAGITSVKPETYELYLKGKYYLNKSTVADWQRGIVYLEEAVDQNAGDPFAYAGLAEGYVTLGHSLTPPPDVFPKALAAAKRAIQLDSSNAEGWAALSHYHTYFGWDWDLAEYAFEKANKINPNMAYNHYHRAWYLALFGRMDEAITEHRLAQKIDPFISLHTAWLGGLYRMAGAYEKGLVEAERASGMQHDNALSMYIKGSIYVDMGRTEEGLKLLEQASNLNPGWRYYGYGMALFKTGRFEEGMEIIQELEAKEVTPFYSLCLAYLYFNADNLDKGFEWLQSAKGHAFYPWIRVKMPNPKVKKDSRYMELLKELGLPPPSPLIYNDNT